MYIVMVDVCIMSHNNAGIVVVVFVLFFLFFVFRKLDLSIKSQRGTGKR